MIAEGRAAPDDPQAPVSVAGQSAELSQERQGGRAVEHSGPSRRAILGWTAGMFAALGLAWFAGAVAVPHYATWAILREGANTWGWDHHGAIARLGGPEKAEAELKFYLRMPRLVAPHRAIALDLLFVNGSRSSAELVSALLDGDEGTRECVARLLGDIGPDAAEAVPALERTLNDPAPRVRAAAAEALQRVRGEEPPK